MRSRAVDGAISLSKAQEFVKKQSKIQADNEAKAQSVKDGEAGSSAGAFP